MGYFAIELPQLTRDTIINMLRGKKFPFFLDSGGYFEKIGRYSYWGFDPVLTFYFKNDTVYMRESGKEKCTIKIAPFDFLEKIFKQYRQVSTCKKFSFQGGFVGYLGYELGRYIENIPTSRHDDYNLPDYCFALYDVVFVHDIVKNRFFVAGYELNDQTYDKAKNLFESVTRYSSRVYSESRIKIGDNLKSNFKKEEYLNAIEKAKKYILAGDIYQVNISQRFKTDFKGDTLSFYNYFSKLSPAPFSAYFDYADYQIISNSPERYLFIDGKHIETRPIKGTRPRGKNLEQDRKYINELKTSEKDKAEHLMIVDLERNDLGRVAEFSSVKVSEFEIIESYANVHHMVSTVEAVVDKKFSVVDCIKNSYPGGSITGAPKIRAMEIIDELEPTYRSVYTGSIGYVGFDETVDLNIAIRTAIIKDGKISFQVGGGIVADSVPEEEFDETVVKAESFIKTLEKITQQ